MAKVVKFLGGTGEVPYDPGNKAEIAEYERIVANISDESRRALEEIAWGGHFVAMVAEEFQR